MHPWLNCLRRNRECVSLERRVSPGQRDASAALARSRAARRDAEGRGLEVTEAVAELRLSRERNHFAEKIYQLFQGVGG